MAPANFNNIHDFTSEQIGHLSGKVVLITGGNTGLGYETIKHLAPHGATIVFTSRSTQKADEAIAGIKKDIPNANVSFLQMDLTSLASVQAAARAFVQSHSRLDILMTNAGIMNAPAALTTDGYELQFGTNHMGHALLIKLLLPILLRTACQPDADVRIVCLTSEGFRAISSIDFAAQKTAMASWLPAYGYIRYGHSKLANLLYAKQLAQRYPQITSVSVHPGVVSTNLIMNRSAAGRALLKVSTGLAGLKMIGPAQGALNQTWAAVGKKEQMESGAYYTPVGVRAKVTKVVEQRKVERELWDWTQEELKAWEL